jgi:hypothetical protein
MNEQPKATYGLDVYRLYDAHRFDLQAPTRTPTNIKATWQKHGWIPPSEMGRKASNEDKNERAA